MSLDPRVTTLVGKTDAGKSTVIRALALVCLSRWHKSYVRHGEKYVTVRLDADDQVIVREKGKGRNLYSLDGKKFAAFANSVPPEIGRLLNVGPDNFQFQLDTHFWFSDTSGQVSKKLNQIVNLDVIDKTLANVASEVRNARAELSVSERRLNGAKEKVRDLKWVPGFVRDFDRVEKLQEETRELRSSVLSFSALVESARKYAAQKKKAVIACNDAGRVLASRQQSEELRRQIDALEGLIGQIRKTAKWLQLPEIDSSELEAVRKEGDVLAEDIRNLEILTDELTKAEGRVCQLDEKIAAAEKSITGRKCPLCGSALSAGSSRTYTCATPHRSPGPRRTTGRTSSSAASTGSGDSATRTDVPW